MASDWVVLLECGHWFNESRPDGLDVDPMQMRACSRAPHYPRQFAAVSLETELVAWPDKFYTITRVDDSPLEPDESYDTAPEVP